MNSTTLYAGLSEFLAMVITGLYSMQDPTIGGISETETVISDPDVVSELASLTMMLPPF